MTKHFVIRQTSMILMSSMILAGCVRVATGVPIASPGQVRQPLVVGKKFRVVVLDFGSKDEGKEESTAYLERTLPAMILKELRNPAHGADGEKRQVEEKRKDDEKPEDGKNPRFAIYDGGIARWREAAISEANAKEFADAYLTGTIVARRAEEVCFEVRLANAVNHQVLFVSKVPICAKLKTSEASAYPRVAEEAATKLEAQLSDAVLKIGNGKIVSANGKLVTINMGRKSHVLPGMPGYIVDTGVSTNNPAIDEVVRAYTALPVEDPRNTHKPPPDIVGEVYVLSVEEDYSVGLLFRGDYALPGDTVYFK
jgi:hypothetical protein